MDPKSRSLRLRSAGKQNFGMVEIGGRAEIFFFFFFGGVGVGLPNWPELMNLAIVVTTGGKV